MWGRITGVLSGLFNSVGSTILGGLGRLASGVSSAANDVWDAIQSLINTAIQALSSVLDALHSAVSFAWGILSDAFSVLEQGFNSLISAIWSAVSWIYRIGLPGIYAQLKAAFDAVASLAQSIGTLIANQVNNLVNLIESRINDTISFIIHNVYEPLSGRLDSLTDRTSTLSDFVHGLLDDPTRFGKWLIFPLIDVIIDGWETIAKYAGRAVVSLVIHSITQFPQVVEDILTELL